MSGNGETDKLSENEQLDQAQESEAAIDSDAPSVEPELVPEDDQNATEELTPEQQVENLAAMLVKAQEDVLRAKAEEQNAVRRASLDVEKARKFALEGFAKELLPVVDNLERAIASMDPEQENLDSVKEGVELTLKTLTAALEKNRVKVIDPEGESFNPDLHQAMAMVENKEVEPNSVIEVFQKGYELNGRLIRPAMVVVSK